MARGTFRHLLASGFVEALDTVRARGPGTHGRRDVPVRCVCCVFQGSWRMRGSSLRGHLANCRVTRERWVSGALRKEQRDARVVTAAGPHSSETPPEHPHGVSSAALLAGTELGSC